MAGRIFASLKPSAMNRDEFTAAFGAIFEHAPWVAEQVWQAGIDSALDEIANMHEAMAAAIAAAGRSRQDELIAGHPELAAPQGPEGLTASSQREQAGAGLAALDGEQRARFAQLNSSYRAKFGFPFVLAVDGLDSAAILAAFEQRLAHEDRERERAEALEQIVRIGRLRLDKL